MSKFKNRVFRITKFYGKENSSRWIKRIKELYDNENSFAQGLKRFKQEVIRRQTGLFKHRLVVEEFIGNDWVVIEIFPELKENVPDEVDLAKERKEKWQKINQKAEEDFRRTKGLDFEK